MSEMEYIIGFDLGEEFSRISCFNREKMQPGALAGSEEEGIPTALCLLLDGSWLAGRDALSAAGEGRGTLYRRFMQEKADRPLQELLYCFLKQTLQPLTGGRQISALTLTVARAGRELQEAAAGAARSLGVPEGRFALVSHSLSFAYYALSQSRELWSKDVGLFEFAGKGLLYTHLEVSLKKHPAAVRISSADYSGDMELPEPADETRRDAAFAAVVEKVSADRQICAFYLLGEAFDSEENMSWMDRSLKTLCGRHRHVFMGQNLYGRGAAWNSYFLMEPSALPDVQILGGDISEYSLVLKTNWGAPAAELVLLPAGGTWYGSSGMCCVMTDDMEKLPVSIRDLSGKERGQALLPLDFLPARPQGCTKLRLCAKLTAAGRFQVSIEDLGFGSMFPASGQKKVCDFGPDGKTGPEDVTAAAAQEDTGEPFGAKEAAGTPVPEKEGRLLEAFEPCADAFTAPVSGVKIYSPEELCYYIAGNIYAITPEFFSGQFYDWLDEAAGTGELSRRMRQLADNGKGPSDMAGLLLRAVRYLDDKKTADLIRAIGRIEEETPLQRCKSMADSLCTYGRYMQALKQYHHGACLMTGDGKEGEDAAFCASFWNNMAVCLLHLHDLTSAADSMRRASEADPAGPYVRRYLYILRMGKMDRLIHDEAVSGRVTETDMQDIMREYDSAVEEYDRSERCADLKGKFLSRKEQDRSCIPCVKEFTDNLSSLFNG